MRQSGVIAAAALDALEHNPDRLAEDDDNAHHLAAGHRQHQGPRAARSHRMQTNLVFFDIKKPGMTARPVRRGLQRTRRRHGHQCRQRHRIRAVTDLYVNRADIERR